MKNNFCNFTPVLPTIYDDSLSYMEMIEKLAKAVDNIHVDVGNEIDKKISDVETELNNNITNVETELNNNITNVETELNNKILGIIASDFFVNVKDYGAIGDNVADDSDAISNAYKTGKTLYFPDGIYRLEKNIEIANAIGKATLNPVNATIFINKQYANIRNLIISGLETTTALQVNASYVRIENCTFPNGDLAVKLNGNSNIISNCVFALQNTGCILIDNELNPDTGDNVITGCSFDNGNPAKGFGISIYSGGGLYVTNCKFLHFNVGIWARAVRGVTSVLCVTNNSFEAIEQTAIISTGNFHRIIVSSNEIISKATAVSFSNIEEIIINSNILNIETGTGILIALTNCSYGTVVGNVARYYGTFIVQNECNHIIVASNSNNE